MRVAVVTLLVMAVVAACAKPLEVSSITEITPRPGASGIDVHAGRRASGEQAHAPVGEQIVEVRTYRVAGGGTAAQEEIAGATCEIRGAAYSAEVVTPGKVRLPLYRNTSNPVSISCSKDGFDPKVDVIDVVNISQAERNLSGSSTGFVGVRVASSEDAGSDPGSDEYHYPNARVVMTPAAQVAAASNLQR